MKFALQTPPPRPRPPTPLPSFLFQFFLGNSRDCAAWAGQCGPAWTLLWYPASRCPPWLQPVSSGLKCDVQGREGGSPVLSLSPRPGPIWPIWEQEGGTHRGLAGQGLKGPVGAGEARAGQVALVPSPSLCYSLLQGR